MFIAASQRPEDIGLVLRSDPALLQYRFQEAAAKEFKLRMRLPVAASIDGGTACLLPRRTSRRESALTLSSSSGTHPRSVCDERPIHAAAGEPVR